MCSVFCSLKGFLKSLIRSDDFGGEHFDNVSQSKSEKEREEKKKKKIIDKQVQKEKDEAEKINDLIKLKMQQFNGIGRSKPQRNTARKECSPKSHDDLSIK